MDLLRQLAGLMLPSQILDYFEVVKVEQSATLIEISLDELYPDSYKCTDEIASKGFMEHTTITDFPIRDHKLLLHIRRRRWLNRKDGVSFGRPLNLVVQGTCYSKDFAAFLLKIYIFIIHPSIKCKEITYFCRETPKGFLKSSYSHSIIPLFFYVFNFKVENPV